MMTEKKSKSFHRVCFVQMVWETCENGRRFFFNLSMIFPPAPPYSVSVSECVNDCSRPMTPQPLASPHVLWFPFLHLSIHGIMVSCTSFQSFHSFHREFVFKHQNVSNFASESFLNHCWIRFYKRVTMMELIYDNNGSNPAPAARSQRRASIRRAPPLVRSSFNDNSMERNGNGKLLFFSLCRHLRFNDREGGRAWIKNGRGVCITCLFFQNDFFSMKEGGVDQTGIGDWTWLAVCIRNTKKIPPFSFFY